MGRSTASCFKIITCADPVDATDDVEAPEVKTIHESKRFLFLIFTATFFTVFFSVSGQNVGRRKGLEILQSVVHRIFMTFYVTD